MAYAYSSTSEDCSSLEHISVVLSSTCPSRTSNDIDLSNTIATSSPHVRTIRYNESLYTRVRSHMSQQIGHIRIPTQMHISNNPNGHFQHTD